MKLSDLVNKVSNKTLTCSEVLELLMDQPTQKGVSHAHMHMREGFQLSKPGFASTKKAWSAKLVDKTLSKKTAQWEGDAHLYPSDVAQPGRSVFRTPAELEEADAHNPYHVFQDADRLPADRSYANRTGLGELPAITTTNYRVWQSKAGGPPEAVTINTQAELAGLAVGNAAGQYKAKGGKGPDANTLKYQEVTTTSTAKADASPAHSMFTDSESMVMHLTAALLSEAGKQVLQHLLLRIAPGGNKTVGIFSKAAVRAVKAADPSVPSAMLLRTLKVDQSKPRDSATGRYPATGEVKVDKVPIDHVVVVLGHRLNGHLTVITCYPSAVSTGASITTVTTLTEDIAEVEFGVHGKVLQVDAPKLNW